MEGGNAPRVDQKAKVAAEAAMTEKQKRPAMVSASRCTGASRACAAATSRPMPASMLPAPVLDARTVIGASNTTVPAVTCTASSVMMCDATSYLVQELLVQGLARSGSLHGLILCLRTNCCTKLYL